MKKQNTEKKEVSTIKPGTLIVTESKPYKKHCIIVISCVISLIILTVLWAVLDIYYFYQLTQAGSWKAAGSVIQDAIISINVVIGLPAIALLITTIIYIVGIAVCRVHIHHYAGANAAEEIKEGRKFADKHSKLWFDK